jgi:hypothetical protein
MKLPKVGDEGTARHRGLVFRARVLCVVSGRDGPALSVTATGRSVWHRLPAAAVLVRPSEFLPLPRLHTHDDLSRAGVVNHDEGRTCAFCDCDVPSGYRHEHGQGVCVQEFTHTAPR